MRDQFGNREDHLVCRGVLKRIARYDGSEAELLRIRYLVGCDEVRSQRAEAVEGLCPDPLTFFHLNIARRDIVGNGVSGDGTERIFPGNILASTADDYGKFNLVVDFCGNGGIDDDRRTAAGEGAGMLRE